MDDFFVLGKWFGSMVAQERPRRILEISDGGNEYGYLLKALQARCGIANGVVDRLALSEALDVSDDAVYGRILGEECLDNVSLLDKYDVILILDLQDRLEPEKARALLDALQHKITKQILFLAPFDSQAGYRKYHPVVFMGLDFSYSIISGLRKAVQAYNVFPKTAYAKMHIDSIPTLETAEKMRIAFALSHQGITGGMKALLQQIRHLKRKGHDVIPYYRSDCAKSAIPPWSDLTEDDYTKQVVLPASSRFIDGIQDVDIIVLAGIHQAVEFVYSKIPAVLWEQGCEAMFGDFQKALYSTSDERRYHHAFYRLPVHLLAVSDVLSTALKGIYNRDAFVYPNGIDTAFYHPGEKNNDTPIVLLVGHPSLAFKGFHFAFQALRRAYAAGLRFQVKWAAQTKVIHGETNFPLEVIVNPSQHQLADLYRSADVFLSTSLYESYALPPLEAMASGTAVIATDCGGIRTYAKPGENCILCRQGDLSATANALATLLNSPDERQRMAQAGRETALAHAAETVVETLERRLFSIVQHDRQSRAAASGQRENVRK